MSHSGRRRVAVLNRNFGKRFGGAEHYSSAIAEQLAYQYEVHVFAQEIEHSFPGITYHNISKPFNRPRWLNQLWYALVTWHMTRHGFDIVHSHENTWHGNIHTVHVRPFRNGLFDQKTGWRSGLKWLTLITSPRLLTYWWLEWARMRPIPNRKIVATSESVRLELLKSYPLVASILHTIPPGVEPPIITLDKQSMRNQLGLPLDPKLALFVGNDYLKKGLPTLLKALVNIEHLHLAVVGDTRQKEICYQQAKSLGIEKRVHFLGSLQSVEPAYAAADLLVHPTTEDTYGMVVLEAMAHGLPVVVSSSRFCGIASDLKDKHDALILNKPQDADLLTSLINSALSTDNMINIKFHAKQFAKSNKWSMRANQYAEVYKKISSQI